MYGAAAVALLLAAFLFRIAFAGRTPRDAETPAAR
jgi:hypothetical protein